MDEAPCHSHGVRNVKQIKQLRNWFSIIIYNQIFMHKKWMCVRNFTFLTNRQDSLNANCPRRLFFVGQQTWPIKNLLAEPWQSGPVQLTCCSVGLEFATNNAKVGCWFSWSALIRQTSQRWASGRWWKLIQVILLELVRGCLGLVWHGNALRTRQIHGSCRVGACLQQGV